MKRASVPVYDISASLVGHTILSICAYYGGDPTTGQRGDSGWGTPLCAASGRSTIGRARGLAHVPTHHDSLP